MSLIFRRTQRLRVTQKKEALKSKSTKKTATPIALGILAAAVAPLAYLIGFFYYQGYMTGFGVAAENFPISAPDVYIYSYYAIGRLLLTVVNLVTKIFDYAASPPVFYWIITCFAFTVLATYGLLQERRPKLCRYCQYGIKAFKTFAKWLHPKNNSFTKAIGINLILFYLICVLLAVLIYIGFFWWLFPWAAYSGGEDRANEEMVKFLAKGCQLEEKKKWNTCSVVLNEKNEVEHEGLFIAGNDKFFAFFNRNGSYVVPRKETHILKRRYEANDK